MWIFKNDSIIMLWKESPVLSPNMGDNTAKLKADVPILEGFIAKTRDKKDELKQLKSELATLDRKIAVELAPKQENKEDGEEVEHDDTPHSTQTVDGPPRSTDEKKSMVAELPNTYKVREPLSSRIIIGGFRAAGRKL